MSEDALGVPTDWLLEKGQRTFEFYLQELGNECAEFAETITNKDMSYLARQFPETIMKFHSPEYEGINWFAWFPGEIKIQAAGDSCDWELKKPNF